MLSSPIEIHAPRTYAADVHTSQYVLDIETETIDARVCVAVVFFHISTFSARSYNINFLQFITGFFFVWKFLKITDYSDFSSVQNILPWRIYVYILYMAHCIRIFVSKNKCDEKLMHAQYGYKAIAQ